MEKPRSKIVSVIVSVLLVAVLIALLTAVAFSFVYIFHEKYYDKNGKANIYLYDMVFTDSDGNKYAYDFEKTGYDYLYINSTSERLNTDWCYLDSDGYIHYDDDLSISAENETCCIDEDGSLYYPARYATFYRDGTIKYSYNAANFSYDRLGKAYTYDHVPYYDSKGNRYKYVFDSASLKGWYINVSTGEAFENVYCFVDENGFFVYDSNHSFVEQDDIKNVRAYMGPDGETYYLASGIFWNENGELLDSFGKVID